MVAAVGGKVTQARVRAITEGSNALVSQSRVRTVYNFPSIEARASQARLRGVWESGPALNVSQMRIRAIVKGRVDNHRVRAWTFSLDGHNFYVLQLGEQETIVCDLSTGQWMRWQSPQRALWRACLGMNWTGIGADVLNTAGVLDNVVAGDDGFGLIWILAPQQAYDEHPVDASEQAFTRTATGGVPMRMGQTVRCNQLFLSAVKGEVGITVDTPIVTLETSDDAENTWDSQGSITVTADDWTQQFAWRSLGLIGAPGRVFRITDNVLARLDALDMS